MMSYEDLAYELLETIEKIVPVDKHRDYEIIGFAQYALAHPGHLGEAASPATQHEAMAPAGVSDTQYFPWMTGQEYTYRAVQLGNKWQLWAMISHKAGFVIANFCPTKLNISPQRFNNEMDAIAERLKALREAELRGIKAALEAAGFSMPCTAENPNENIYQRGKFDGIMEYNKAIRALSPETILEGK